MKALGVQKLAVARTNMKLGVFDMEQGEAWLAEAVSHTPSQFYRAANSETPAG